MIGQQFWIVEGDHSWCLKVNPGCPAMPRYCQTLWAGKGGKWGRSHRSVNKVITRPCCEMPMTLFLACFTLINLLGIWRAKIGFLCFVHRVLRGSSYPEGTLSQLESCELAWRVPPGHLFIQFLQMCICCKHHFALTTALINNCLILQHVGTCLYESCLPRWL